MTGWEQTPNDLRLTPKYVDVWRTPLDLPKAAIEDFADMLSCAERERADRFCFEAKRNEYVIARGLLRRILARTVGIDPKCLVFTYGAHGKPALDQEWQGRTISFNVSHSHNVALVAVSIERAVGVDVEQIKQNVECESLAQRFFSPNEWVQLMSLPKENRRQAFFNVWARKEAFIKAVGKGISLGLDQFDVSLRPGEPAALLATHWEAAEASRWSMVDLEVGDEYTSALAIEGRNFTLRCWES